MNAPCMPRAPRVGWYAAVTRVSAWPAKSRAPSIDAPESITRVIAARRMECGFTFAWEAGLAGEGSDPGVGAVAVLREPVAAADDGALGAPVAGGFDDDAELGRDRGCVDPVSLLQDADGGDAVHVGGDLLERASARGRDAEAGHRHEGDERVMIRSCLLGLVEEVADLEPVEPCEPGRIAFQPREAKHAGWIAVDEVVGVREAVEGLEGVQAPAGRDGPVPADRDHPVREQFEVVPSHRDRVEVAFGAPGVEDAEVGGVQLAGLTVVPGEEAVPRFDRERGGQGCTV